MPSDGTRVRKEKKGTNRDVFPVSKRVLRTALQSGMTSLFLFCHFFLPAVTTADDGQIPVSIAPGSRHVQIDSRTGESGLTLVIHDSFGIGSARIIRKSDHWPESIQLLYRLKGLEHAELMAGDTKLEWSVPSSHPKTILQSVRVGTEPARPLKSSDPLWVKIEPQAKEGGFQVTLPTVLLKQNPSEITLHWIDFYR